MGLKLQGSQANGMFVVTPLRGVSMVQVYGLVRVDSCISSFRVSVRALGFRV